MSDVPPIGRPVPPAMGRSNTPHQPAHPTSSQNRGRDQVELSRTAQLLSKIHELPDMRQDLIARVREQIQNGTYETPEKLEVAVQKLLEEEGLM